MRSGGFLALALALGGCTHLPWNPHRGWRACKSANVTVYTDTISEYEPVLAWIESAFVAYQSTFFRDQRVPPVKVLYISAEGPTPFLSNAGRYKYGVTIARLPWAQARGADGLVMVGHSPWQWPYHHQLAHHFIESTVPHAPLWFHEGFAGYLTVFSGVPKRPGVLCFGLQQPAATTRVTVPLKELLAAGFADYNETTAPWIGPLSQSFIDYLLHGEGGKLRGRFASLVRALAAGQDGEAALSTIYRELPFARLEAGFHDHVRTLRPPGEECPLPVAVSPMANQRADALEIPVAEEDVRALFQELEQIPNRNGYADFFPDRPKTN